MLDGIINIYLPDIRYSINKYSIELSRAPHYVEYARESIKEMYRQTGNLILDRKGIAVRGLIVRHLILPGHAAGSRESLRWLAEEISRNTNVSIMAQYYPVHKTDRFPLINRRISQKEYAEVEKLAREFGLINGWMQEMDAADSYQPDFAREGNPFD